MPAGAAPGERRGGRAAGTPNRRRVDAAVLAREAVAEHPGGVGALAPLDTLLLLMRTALLAGDIPAARSAAALAAPYVHPKLSSQTIRSTDEPENGKTDADLDAEMESLKAKLRAAGVRPTGGH